MGNAWRNLSGLSLLITDGSRWGVTQIIKYRDMPLKWTASWILEARGTLLLAATSARVINADENAASSPADIPDWAHSIWRAEGQSAPLMVGWLADMPERDLGLDLRHQGFGRANGRWEDGPAPADRSGDLAGTSGPIARLIVAPADSRLQLLHDIAHLLEDGVRRLEGHGDAWKTRYDQLLRRHIGDSTANAWKEATTEIRRRADSGEPVFNRPDPAERDDASVKAPANSLWSGDAFPDRPT